MDGVGCTGSHLGLLLQGCGRLLSSIGARNMLSQGASSLVPTACFLGLCTNGKWDELLCQTTCMATTNSMNFTHGHSSLGNGTSQIDCSSGHALLLFYILQCCTLLHTHTHTHTSPLCPPMLHPLTHTHTHTHTHFSLATASTAAPSYTHTYFSSTSSKAVPSYTHIHTHTQHTYTHTHNTHIYTSPLRPPKIAPSYRHTHTHSSSSTSSKAVPSYTHTHIHTHTPWSQPSCSLRLTQWVE